MLNQKAKNSPFSKINIKSSVDLPDVINKVPVSEDTMREFLRHALGKIIEFTLENVEQFIVLGNFFQEERILQEIEAFLGEERKRNPQQAEKIFILTVKHDLKFI